MIVFGVGLGVDIEKALFMMRVELDLLVRLGPLAFFKWFALIHG